jgi:hypothetical protein
MQSCGVAARLPKRFLCLVCLARHIESLVGVVLCFLVLLPTFKKELEQVEKEKGILLPNEHVVTSCVIMALWPLSLILAEHLRALCEEGFLPMSYEAMFLKTVVLPCCLPVR